MRVIGTAGHVDHGKSTLIEALSGTHPDRLKEEREREMTIDLGFAWMDLPTGPDGELEEVGIVDVPGHRDFIENMLAGIGGIDAALFVVAADEGVMPQTREHLAILDLLQIQGGVIVLTKIDMVDDPDWLDLVESDVQAVLSGTVLEACQIVRVSARTGSGLEDLKLKLGEALAARPERVDLSRPRLPIDRVFTIAGFGTVVTGTLTDGSLHVGDELEVHPRALHGRVRGLQTHKQKEQVAIPGSRTAVNISGVPLEAVQRGDVLAHPGDYNPTKRMDVRFRLLKDVSQPLKHNTEVKLFIGTSETIGRIRLLGVDELAPGQEGWLQLELNQPVIGTRGDRYILRRPSPGETLGGGSVIDPHPKGRHKRFIHSTIESLEAISRGKPSDVLLQALLASGATTLKDVFSRSNLDLDNAGQALSELYQSGEVLNLDGNNELEASAPDDLLIARFAWDQLSKRILDETTSYHASYPLRRGLPREQLKSRLKEIMRGSVRLFNAAVRRLISEARLVESGPLVYLPDHTIRFNAQQQKQADQLLARFAAASYSPPSTKESIEQIGEDLFDALVETSKLVRIAPDVVFRREEYERMLADVRSLIEQRGSLTVAQARDHFNTSRRYVLAFLEHLDAIGVTAREGDERRLK